MVAARPLSPAEQSEVAQLLRSEETTLFWSQHVADQRHGLETARKLREQRPDDMELIRAGLLHDVGKAGTALGPIGRTLATLAGLLRLPPTSRQQAYLSHGPIGAAELRKRGAAGLVVTFAEFHPAPPPPGVDEARWRLLLDADDD